MAPLLPVAESQLNIISCKTTVFKVINLVFQFATLISIFALTALVFAC